MVAFLVFGHKCIEFNGKGKDCTLSLIGEIP